MMAKPTSFRFVAVSAIVFVLLGIFLQTQTTAAMQDFKAVYYSSKCIFEHCDPYNSAELLRSYLAAGGETHPDQLGQRQGIILCVYPPSMFLALLPVTLLPWKIAVGVWTFLISACLALAAAAMWDLGADYSPGLSAVLAGFCLVNSVGVLVLGNAAGIAVSLCIVAVWCFARNRYTLCGVIALGLSLSIKPHDSGLIWLVLLLSPHRKKALQSAGLALALAVIGTAWVMSLSPHWLTEMHSNLAEMSSIRGGNNPGPRNPLSRTVGMVLSLQSIFSVFQDTPYFYNRLSYGICGVGLMIALLAFRRPRVETMWTCFAAVVPLTLLITYHRPYDARLLLLAVPACARLWKECGLIRYAAVGITALAFAFTGDLTLAVWLSLTRNILADPASVMEKLGWIVIARPMPLSLLIAACFYGWVLFDRRTVVGFVAPQESSPSGSKELNSGMRAVLLR
jgi:hypothetical protein